MANRPLKYANWFQSGFSGLVWLIKTWHSPGILNSLFLNLDIMNLVECGSVLNSAKVH